MRALAVRQDNNGDVILTGPALRGLARAFDAVDLLVSPSGAGAAALMPGVRETMVARTEWIDGHPQPVDRATTDALVDRIAACAYDHAFVFTSFHQSPLPTALVLRLAGVKQIHAISVDYPGSLLDTRARVPDEIHEVERNLWLLAAAGVPLPDDDRLELTGLPGRDTRLPPAYVVVQPAASVPARAWYPERNRELVAALASDGHDVVVAGSAAERDLCAFVADGRALVCCDRSFAEFAALVRDARAIVVGNTAGAHVASATQTPVVSIFPPTIPFARFRPWRVPYEIFGRQDIGCAGCRARECPLPGQPCLAEIAVRALVSAVDRLAPRVLVSR